MRPATTSAAFDRSASPPPLFLNMSLTTVSNIPSGRYTSAATSAIVPVNPSGATPTTVKSSALMRIVLPTNDGSRRSFFQRAYVMIATGMCAPGRSSSAVKVRPAASRTPSVSK